MFSAMDVTHSFSVREWWDNETGCYDEKRGREGEMAIIAFSKVFCGIVCSAGGDFSWYDTF